MFCIQEDSFVNLPRKIYVSSTRTSSKDSTSTVFGSCVENLWLQETVYILLLSTDIHSMLVLSWVGRTLEHNEQFIQQKVLYEQVFQN